MKDKTLKANPQGNNGILAADATPPTIPVSKADLFLNRLQQAKELAEKRQAALK